MVCRIRRRQNRLVESGVAQEPGARDGLARFLGREKDDVGVLEAARNCFRGAGLETRH